MRQVIPATTSTDMPARAPVRHVWARRQPDVEARPTEPASRTALPVQQSGAHSVSAGQAAAHMTTE